MEMCKTSQTPLTLMWVVRSVDEFGIFSEELTSAQRSHKNFNARVWITLSSLKSSTELNFSKADLLEFDNFGTALRSFRESLAKSPSAIEDAPTFVLDQPSLSGASNAIAMTLSIFLALVAYVVAAKLKDKDAYADTAQDFISLMELSLVCLFVLLWVLALGVARFVLARRSTQGSVTEDKATADITTHTVGITTHTMTRGSSEGSVSDVETSSSDDGVLQSIVEGSIGCRPKIEQEFAKFANAIAQKKGRPVDIAVLACGPPNMVKSINDCVNVPSNSCSFGIEKDQLAHFSFIEEDWEW